MLSIIILLSGALLMGAPATNPGPGTAAIPASPDTLRTAIVSAERGISVSRSDTLKSSASQTIGELILQSPGLVLADYGGAAGVKTVNLRGLGSPHTSIRIDGIKVMNLQSGQTDLGMLGLENFGGAVIDYAQNSIDFKTARPVFNGRSIAGRFAFSGGSFSTFLPQGRLDFKLSDRLCISAHAAGIVSKGDFDCPDGTKRENNDISQIKAGMGLFGITDGGDWMAKLYYNGSERGAPGSTDYPSTDRQEDRNAFAQGYFRKRLSALYSLDISAKLAFDEVRYTSAWGDSDYRQKELQLNTAHKFNINGWLTLSAVAELSLGGINSTYYRASRTGITAIAGAAFKLNRFRSDLTLQYERIADKGGLRRDIVSPALDLRFRASETLDITGFARRAFRAPTFNELYYPGYGNPDLRPEDAWLTDIGLDWHRSASGHWTFKAKLDAFYNFLTDKILSAPSEENPSQWLPYNIGTVRAKGLDAEAAAGYASNGWKTSFCARYSFQTAEDVPYLAKHTAVLTASADYRTWSVDAVWNLRAGRRDSYGPMPDWDTLDITASKEFHLKNNSILSLEIICRNLTDREYALVTGYPMPGRSLTAGLAFSF